jgi:hypothetical protein
MANAPFPPFVKKGTEEAPQTAAAPVAAKEPKPKKEKGERQAPAKMMNVEQINQVIALVPTKSYTEIAEMLGITKHQVNRVLMEVKKSLREKAKDNPVMLAKAEEFIKANLSRPEDTRPGATGPKGGKVKNALGDIVGNILAGL